MHMKLFIPLLVAAISIGSNWPSHAQDLPGNIAILVLEYGDADGDCRGLSPDNPRQKVGCDRREATSNKLADAGYCRGKDGQSGFEHRWHRCAPGSIGWAPSPGTNQSSDKEEFLQIINYLFTGNTHYKNPTTPRGQRRGVEALSTDVKVIDQENCIVEVEESSLTGHFRATFYFNNVMRHSLTWRQKGSTITILGEASPYLADFKSYDRPGMLDTPIGSGQTKNLSLEVENTTIERAKTALNLLYGKHCKGKKSAF